MSTTITISYKDIPKIRRPATQPFYSPRKRLFSLAEDPQTLKPGPPLLSGEDANGLRRRPTRKILEEKNLELKAASRHLSGDFASGGQGLAPLHPLQAPSARAFRSAAF
ncbi:hypothetical protein [Desulfovibrio sp. Fe33]|uniref:hypothetical protein n=1 Tax=Desulfovibrio sp. Fe33 TaxID=3020842 RepID=UPI00234DEDE9|nr:hypothetical protein [Desulfovibrio sp. Fe33]